MFKLMSRRLAAILALLLVSGPVLALQEDFPFPEEFSRDVAFWKRIYSEVETSAGLVHDSRYLDIVYGELELPEGAGRAERRRLSRQARERYRQELLALAEDPAREDGEAARIREMFGDEAGPADYRAAADRVRFQLGQADRFRAGLERAGRWEAHIRQIMNEHDVPEGMVALPHVESSFTPYARSRAGAAGMWQFTRGTGQRFMRVDEVVDERLDPWLSSEAAARLLRHNYEVTGSWPLALNAYNHGAAGIRRAIDSVGEADIVRIAREYEGPRYGFASRNFYPAFLAALQLHDAPHAYFDDLRPEPALPAQTLVMEDYIAIYHLAEALGEPIDRLRDHNPALRRVVWDGHAYVPAGYELRLPPGIQLGEARERLAELPPQQRHAAQARNRYHVVQRGETLSHVAARHGTTVRELARINGLTHSGRIRVGQRIRLPGRGQPRREAPPADGVYTIRPGDNLSLIAQRFGSSVPELANKNELDPDDPIMVGDQLRIPGTETAAAESADTGTAEGEEAVVEEPAREEVVAEYRIDSLQLALGRVIHGLGGNLAMAMEDGPARALEADPSDYAVRGEGLIEVQWAETLGHFADWLEIPTQRLRELNGLAPGVQVSAGEELRLDHSEVDAGRFEDRRIQYHQRRQQAFFEQYRIAGTREHEVSRGDSVWSITRQYAPLPVWLLQQHNPDADMTTLRPGQTLQIPRLDSRDS